MPSLVSFFTSTVRRAAAVLVAATVAVPLGALPAQADQVVRRTYGPDRITTAVEASENFRRTATDALLTTADSFPDALAATALAHALDAPLLLTHRDQLPAPVSGELDRLGVERVWILGGESAVGPAVHDALADAGYEVARLAGDSRYATAAEIARAAGPSATGEVVIALGEHDQPSRAWPDAVASSTLAATPDRVPTLLTRPRELPEETAAALRDLDASSVILLGGETAIHPEVEQALVDGGYAVERVAGSSRYETSIELAADALGRFGADSRPAVFASGSNFPDALAAGAVAAGLGAPLVLVPPTSLHPANEAFLRDHADLLTSGVLVGGPAAATDFVVEQLDAVLQGSPMPAPEPAPEPQPTTAAAEQPAGPTVVSTFTGMASWYGPGFEGRPTASGEPFNPRDLTAAHRTLPFGTIVRVTNLSNGAVVTVRINDRGPYSHSRVLDLSSAAADVLGMKHDGVAHVRGEILG